MACLSLLSGVHPLPLLLLITLLGPVALVRGVTFRVVNKCPFPVWPAAAPNAGHPVLAGGGFLLPPGQSRRVSAPPTWNGRFWGRTGCNFTSTATNHHGNAAAACLTGDCGGRLACNGTAGAPPATLVEVDLHEDQSKGSSYDVSLVDGYNLPVAVWTKPPTPGAAAADRKCVIPGCAKNVNAVCPPELQVTAAAAVVSCKSACVAFGTDAFCCRGAHGTAETCRGSAYSRVFRDACPAYVSYPYDTAAAAARCYAEVYVLTFCPSRWGAGADRVAQA
ncbi:hypothetical protein OsI_33545 [Oryza sativa Indica Group]|uniref:Thaumatin-like protein n=1 Tax=Oryza sativa subsp. indica TaxID=39946 RepID=A2Z772_ORYSI|nr:hypothetical protein OsI_33545 [Oryza sativa Indica Group]